MKVPTIRQKPWYIGLISSLVVDRSLRNVGLTAEVQNFDRGAYDASIPIVPAATRGGVVGTDLEYVARDGFRNAARWYAPPERAAATTPLLVYLHGGGWALNDARHIQYEILCSNLARDMACDVVSLNYRLAPEHPYPRALEDVYDACEWLSENAHVAPAADRQRLVLLGDSAGGNLAACVSLAARDLRPTGWAVAHQVLCSPCLPLRPRRPSRVDPARADGAFLPAWAMTWFEEAYAGERTVEELSNEPYANPLAAATLAGMPPTTAVVGGAESLRDEGIELCDALRAAGVDVECREYEGAFHAFVVLPFVADAKDAWAFVHSRLRVLF